jgi:hypothetical protein
MRIPCTACAIASIKERRYCHECKGKGYIEKFDRVSGCNRHPEICPLESEEMRKLE